MPEQQDAQLVFKTPTASGPEMNQAKYASDTELAAHQDPPISGGVLAVIIIFSAAITCAVLDAVWRWLAQREERQERQAQAQGDKAIAVDILSK